MKIVRDGLVYVCDRANNRIQVFQKDGTFVREFFLEGHARQRRGVGPRPVTRPGSDLGVYNADGENNHVWVLCAAAGRRWAGSVENGRYAGQFHWIHNLAADSKGNIYTAEVDTGKRAQKLRLTSQLPR